MERKRNRRCTGVMWMGEMPPLCGKGHCLQSQACTKQKQTKLPALLLLHQHRKQTGRAQGQVPYQVVGNSTMLPEGCRCCIQGQPYLTKATEGSSVRDCRNGTNLPGMDRDQQRLLLKLLLLLPPLPGLPQLGSAKTGGQQSHA